MARIYQRNITLDELSVLCAKNGWRLNTEKYDNEGSDFVSFKWRFKRKTIEVIYSSFNGNFIAEFDGQLYSDRSSIDGTDWFDTLLDVLYTNTPLAVAA